VTSAKEVATGYQTVTVSVDSGIGTLTLNRPDKLNAIDDVMARELIEASRELLTDPAVRALVITGAGRGFSAGGDVKFLGSCVDKGDFDTAMSLVRMGGQLVRSLRESPKPILASINGVAAGGGANLALGCDLRIASDQAGIGQVFHRIGLHPDWGGTWFVPELAGPAAALELIWSAEVIPVKRCMELGLVNRVVPHDQLAVATREWALKLAALPPIAAGLAKQAVYASHTGTLADALAREEANQERCFKTSDAKEGFKSFGEKRAPRFEGR
jgi:2-(1,2-epoxy-1,2-dihydrophenyl)acetyl-CoA isomerase